MRSALGGGDDRADDGGRVERVADGQAAGGGLQARRRAGRGCPAGRAPGWARCRSGRSGRPTRWRWRRRRCARSASSNTTAAPLPPSSSSRRFMSRPATSPMRRPTAVEPVKLTMSTCGRGDQRLAGVGAAAGDDVDHAGREPGLDHGVGEPQHGQGVLRRGLDHDRVAHGQRGADLAGHVDQREVVGRDAGDDADGPALDHGAEQAAGRQGGRRASRWAAAGGRSARARRGRSGGSGRSSGAPAWSWRPACVAPVSACTSGTRSSTWSASMSASRASSAAAVLGRGAAPRRERLGRGPGGGRSTWSTDTSGAWPTTSSVAGLTIVVGAPVRRPPGRPPRALRTRARSRLRH